MIRVDQDPHVLVRWTHREGRPRFDEGLMDLFCASRVRLKENIVLLKSPRGDAKSGASLSPGDEVQVLERSSGWIKIKHLQKGEGWTLWNRLESLNDDIGVYVPLIPTELREKASTQSPTILKVPLEARLIAKAYHSSGWVRVDYEGRSGYIDMQHLVGRADFAQWAWQRKNGWFLVAHRNGSSLIGQDGRKVPLSQILGFAPNDQRWIVSKADHESGIPLRAHAEIIRIETTLWGVSQLPGHGVVWWKKDHLAQLKTTPQEQETLTTEEFLKRPIFSYDVEEKSSLQGLASSQGVWRTLDGRTWTRIPQFGNQDLPVAIHPKGVWLVGTYRSVDRGLSFENSIRWDQLARSVENKLKQTPKKITLQKLSVLPNSDIQILLDTGRETISLRSQLESSHWE